MGAGFKEETEIINSYIYLAFTVNRAFPNCANCVVSFISWACYVLCVLGPCTCAIFFSRNTLATSLPICHLPGLASSSSFSVPQLTFIPSIIFPGPTTQNNLHTPLMCFHHHSYPVLFWCWCFCFKLNSRLHSDFASLSISPFFCSRFKSRNNIVFSCRVSLVSSDLWQSVSLSLHFMTLTVFRSSGQVYFVETLLCVNCVVTYQSYVDCKGSLWGQIPCGCLYTLAFIPLGILFNTMYTE